MGNCHWKTWRSFNQEHERTATRLCLSLREWFSYNPFHNKNQEEGTSTWDGDLGFSRSARVVALYRILWCVFVICLATLGAMGVASVAGGGDCGSDSHSCESTYYYKWMAYHHSIMFLGSVGLMFWAGSFCAARLRDSIMMIALIAPLIFLWSKSDVSSECTTWYKDNCEQIYDYAKICRIADAIFAVIVVAFEVGAFVSKPEDDDTKNIDLSIVDHLYQREDEAWRRPLLVDSSIKNFKTNIVDWQTVVTNRNETLRKAVDIASKTHANSTTQATMLGKYSSLIEESSEKVTRASSLLDEQSAQIGELNDTVNEVIQAMGTPADMDLSSFTGMTANDVKLWCYVLMLVCLILITLLLGIPKWLHLFDISLGIKI